MVLTNAYVFVNINFRAKNGAAENKDLENRIQYQEIKNEQLVSGVRIKEKKASFL